MAGGRDFAYTHNMFNREAGIITVSASGANAGFVNYWEEEIFASDCTTIKADKNVTTKWIYYYLKMIQEQIFEVLQKGSSQPHVYAEDLKLIPIPLISIKLQTKIVNKCSKIDDEYNTTRMSIENYRKKIEDLFNDLEVIASEGGVNLVRLSEICLDIFAGGDAPADYREKPDSEYYVPIYSNGTAENALYGYGKEPKVTEDAITISARGTIGFTEYRKAPFIPIVRLIVLIPDTDKVNVQFLKYSVKCLKFENTGKTTPQLTVPNVRNLKIKLPLDPEKQNEIISRVNEIEAKITEAEKKLEGLKNKTGEIVKSYLS